MSDPFVILSMAVVLFLFLHTVLQFFGESPKAQLQLAQADYVAAINTREQNVRKEKFNAALKALLELEEQYQPSMGNGKLYSNIGAIFFQLQEYPMSLLYYYRAKALRPRDEKLAANLAISQQKAHLQVKAETTPQQRLFFFHYDFSIPERLQLFAIFFIGALLTATGSIWLHRAWMEKVSLLLLLFSMLFVISLGWSYCFSSTEGVLLNSEPLFRGPGRQYAKVSEEPEIAGSKVEVLETNQEGNWVKVQTATGTIGYIYGEGIQLIGISI